MKKLIVIIFLLLGYFAQAQTVGQFRYDTTKFLKIGGRNHVMIENLIQVTDSTYKALVIGADGVIKKITYWPGTGTGGGGSGITSLGAGYGLINVNDSTYAVDSTLFATQYDLEGYIPLSGTVYGNEITGDLNFMGERFLKTDIGSGYAALVLNRNENTVSFQRTSRDATVFQSFGNFGGGDWVVSSDSAGARGLVGATYFTPKDYLTYTQKHDIDLYKDTLDADIAGKVNISDTAAMLNGYVRRVHGDGSTTTVDNTDPRNPVISATGGGGDSITVINTVYISSAGNNSTAAMNNPAKPFLTINAGLDALPSTGGVVQIGLGSFAPPDSVKMKSNVYFLGSGKPITDMGVTISAYSSYTKTTPTKLVGGTIIRGQFMFPNFIDNVTVRDLGVDVGSDYIANGGTETNGLRIGAISATLANNHIRTGIVVDNISALLSTSGSLFHAVVIENCYNPRVSNIDTYFGFAGFVSKNIGGTFNNINVNGHATHGIILRTNNYAYNENITLTNFSCNSIGALDGEGLWIDGIDVSAGNNNNITISNGVIYKVVDAIRLANLAPYNVTISNLVVSQCTNGINVSTAGTFKNVVIMNSTFTACSTGVLTVANTIGLHFRNNIITDCVTPLSLGTGSLVYGGGNFENNNAVYFTNTPKIVEQKSLDNHDNGDAAFGIPATWATKDANVVEYNSVLRTTTSDDAFGHRALADKSMPASTLCKVWYYSSKYSANAMFGIDATNALAGFGAFDFGIYLETTGKVYALRNSSSAIDIGVKYIRNSYYGINRAADGTVTMVHSLDGYTWTTIYTYSGTTTTQMYIVSDLFGASSTYPEFRAEIRFLKGEGIN